jgi:hypothetical protein
VASELGDAGIERCAGRPERGPGRLIGGSLVLSPVGALLNLANRGSSDEGASKPRLGVSRSTV